MTRPTATGLARFGHGTRQSGRRVELDTRAPRVLRGYLREPQVAEYLRIAVLTATDWMDDGIIPFIRSKHSSLFRITDLDRALDASRHKAVWERWLVVGSPGKGRLTVPETGVQRSTRG